MAQPLPIHSWKLIVPCEVSAVKLGASSFMRNMNCPPERAVLYTTQPQPTPGDGIRLPPWDSSRITANSEVSGRPLLRRQLFDLLLDFLRVGSLGKGL